jgi:hypothetical protein
MAIFGRRGTDASLPKSDRGSGSFDDYTFGLAARSNRVTMVLAGSDPYQDELRTIAESGDSELLTAISPRTIEQERTDEAIVVRLFTGRRLCAARARTRSG